MAQKFKLPSKFNTSSLPLNVDYDITTVSNADKYASYHPYTFRRRTNRELVTLLPTDDCLGRSITINMLTGIPIGMGSVHCRHEQGWWYTKFINHFWMKSKDGQIYDSLRQYQALSDKCLEAGNDYGGYIFNLGENVMSVDMSKEWVDHLNTPPKSVQNLYDNQNKAQQFIQNCYKIANIENVNMIYVENLAWESYQGQLFPYSSAGLIDQYKFMVQDIKGQIEKRFEMSLAESK